MPGTVRSIHGGVNLALSMHPSMSLTPSPQASPPVGERVPAGPVMGIGDGSCPRSSRKRNSPLHRHRKALCLLALGLAGWLASAQEPDATHRSPLELATGFLAKVAGVVEPLPGTPPSTFTATVRIVRAQGLVDGAAGETADLAFQAPDRFRLAARIERRPLILGRLENQLWIQAPEQKFSLVGAAGLPRFSTAPERKDETQLDPVKLPLPREQLLLLPLLFQLESLPEEQIGGIRCSGLKATPQPMAAVALKLPKGEIRLWIRATDGLPARIGWNDGNGMDLLVELERPALSEPWARERWEVPALPGAAVEKVALSHVTHFIPAALSLLSVHLPSLGPATGERHLVATAGQGRLEDHDGTQVLFLKGSPEDMGRQHGTLMRKAVRNLVDTILYGVGVGSSFEKGRWFFGEIEEAQRRLTPFMDDRYLREMDALAQASGNDREEIRLANFFPELFHCSGFALFGRATVDGRMYHGRVLDYLRGVGLEPNAVVLVHQPDYGFAWVNVGYAGFIGTVTAMNEKKISIGEMGGRGEGQWDGKPMAQLLREVMEKASTLDEAVGILRRGPRTCEYYYVVADGNTRRAAGIAATPTTFEIVEPGTAHPRLPHPIADTVLMSAGDRYETLVERVRARHGRLDADTAWSLMDRPVCMNSNIHSALFAPETLDFWVANADSKSVASHARRTRYNLGVLLRGPAAGASTAP